MALDALSCFKVSGYIAPRTIKVNMIIVSPKLPHNTCEREIMLFIIGFRMIRSQIAPISN
jgi:hypothetical protein